MIDLLQAVTTVTPVSSVGVTSYALALPSSPALVGMSFHAQYYTLSAQGAFKASDKAHLILGATPGAPGYSTMIFSNEVVELVEWGASGPLGAAVLDGYVAVSGANDRFGSIDVSLPDGSLVSVIFAPDQPAHMISNGVVVEIASPKGDPAVVVDGTVVPIESMMDQLQIELITWNWSPYTRAMIALSAVLSTEEYGRNALTARMECSNSAGFCEETIDTFCAWLTGQGENACQWIANACNAAGGWPDIFKWFRVDCEFLKWLCRGATWVGIARLKILLEAHWCKE